MERAHARRGDGHQQVVRALLPTAIRDLVAPTYVLHALDRAVLRRKGAGHRSCTLTCPTTRLFCASTSRVRSERWGARSHAADLIGLRRWPNERLCALRDKDSLAAVDIATDAMLTRCKRAIVIWRFSHSRGMLTPTCRRLGRAPRARQLRDAQALRSGRVARLAAPLPRAVYANEQFVTKPDRVLVRAPAGTGAPAECILRTSQSIQQRNSIAAAYDTRSGICGDSAPRFDPRQA